MKLWAKAALLGLLACFTTVYAQNAACTGMVQQALATVETACAPTGRNQACYGNVALLATARDGVQGFVFDKQGDLAGVGDVASLQLQQFDPSTQVWGIAVMKVQANLPDTLPGQNVTFVLFGDVRLDNDGGETGSAATVSVTAVESARVRTGPAPQFRSAGALDKGQTVTATGRTADSAWLLIQIPNSSSQGWVFAGYLTAAGDLTTLPVVEAAKQEVPFKPMQAFYFSTGIGKSNCAAAPDSGILIQTPKGAGKVSLSANDVAIQLGSTAYLQAQAGGSMTISVVEGEGKVSAFGQTVTVPAGMQVKIPIDQNLKASGAPGNAQPYNAAALANLPLALLPDAITVAPSLAASPTRAFPTWTRAPRLTMTPTATLMGIEPSATYADVVPLEPSLTPTTEPSNTPAPPPTATEYHDDSGAGDDTSQGAQVGDDTDSGDDTNYGYSPAGGDDTDSGGDTDAGNSFDQPTIEPTIDPELIA